MKKFFTKKLRKDNKGFSLVELIIVVAIMVALIAVLAPQYIKYVQSSRDAIVKSAADEVMTTAKAEFALGNLSISGTGNGTIVVTATGGNGPVTVTLNNLTYDNDPATTGAQGSFTDICGIDTAKSVKSAKSYTITIGGTAEAPTFAMAETPATE